MDRFRNAPKGFMKRREKFANGFFFRAASVLLFAALILACGSSALTPAAKTLIVEEAPAASAPPTPAPPPTFQTGLLNPLDTPHSYIADTCKYLRARWNPYGAEPGTVVMIIMMRNVTGVAPQNPLDVDNGKLRQIMTQLKAQGFEVVSTERFLYFMERNVKIPPRSALIIRDGNYGKKDFEENFGKYWNEWKWRVVNAWVSGENVSDELWNENALLEYSGFVDHQAGGVQTDARLGEDASKVVIARELQGSLKGFAEHFGKSPVAFIWPNGAFGERPARIARALNYQLGFTMNSRGPVMFNWIPLADQFDPQRPDFLPEGALRDPLMTLPRYYPGEVLSAIDSVRTLGNQAKEFALKNRDAELEYYRLMCEAEYGKIPELKP